MALELDASNFKSHVLDVKGTPVIVDFWAPWCGPCQMQGPILDEVAKAAGAKAVIAKVNVDDNSDLAGQYGIMSIPALKVFKNGEVVEEMVGVHSKPQLMEVIQRHS
jgi:thioredoxin 1